MALSFVASFWRKALRFVLEGSFVAIWITSLTVLSAVVLERSQAQVVLTLAQAVPASSPSGVAAQTDAATRLGAWWRDQRAAASDRYTARIAGDSLVLTCSGSTPRAALNSCNKAARDNLDHGPAIAVRSATRVLPSAPLPVDQLALIGLGFGLAWISLRSVRAYRGLAASRSGLLGMDDEPLELTIDVELSLDDEAIERSLLPLSAAGFEPAPEHMTRVVPPVPSARLAQPAKAARIASAATVVSYEPARVAAAAPILGGEAYSQRVVGSASGAYAQSASFASSAVAVCRHSQLALATVALPEISPIERESSQVVRTVLRPRQQVQAVARIKPIAPAPLAAGHEAVRSLAAQLMPRLLPPPPAAVVVPESLLYAGVSAVSTIGRVTLARSRPNTVIQRGLVGDGSPMLAAFSEETLDALRDTRDRLFRRAQGGACVVRVCADPQSEDAKSQVAAKLALLVAQPRVTRTLLLEADITRPAVDRLLGLETPAELGITRQLKARSESTDAATTVMGVAPTLHVLAEGPNRLPRMLETAHFSSMLGQQRRQYDVIVADGPVAGSWLDTRGLDGVVDHVVFVTGKRTPDARVERLVKQTFAARVELTVIRVNEQGSL